MAALKHKRYLILIAFILLGVIRGACWRPTLPNQYFYKSLPMCGTVGKPTERHRYGAVLILEKLSIKKKDVRGRLKVFMKKGGDSSVAALLLNDSVGTRICFTSVIRPFKNFGIPGEFDFERYYAARKIWGKVSLKKSPIQIVSTDGFYPIQKQRERLSQFLDRYPQGNILKAIVLGIQSDIDSKTKDTFIRSGLIHLLVISGQNIVLVLVALFFLLRWLFSRSTTLLLRFSVYKISVGLSLCVTLIFCVFSGADMPVLRATLMACSFLFSIVLSQPQKGFYALGFALAIILNFWPSSLFDPSFQLSFVAVISLMVMPMVLQKSWRHRSEHPLKLLCVSTLFATVGTAPLVLYHFHRISLISLLSNLVAIPFATYLLLPLAYITAGVFFVSQPMASMLMVLFQPFAKLFIWVAEWFSKVPMASLYQVPPSGFQLLLIYGGAVLVVFYIQGSEKRKALYVGGVSLILLMASGTGLYVIRHSSQNLRVSFLSVGQGDSTLLELPRGKNMLVDAGGLFGSFDVGERLLAPYLWTRGIRTLDVLVLSHSDYDHIQGALFLLREFHVGEIWLSQTRGKKTFTDILYLAEKKNIPVQLLSQKTKPINIGPVQFAFLNPSDPFSQASGNNRSLVIKCQFRKFSLLLTGDIEEDAEDRLATNLRPNLRASVLKVPHHGSRTSSSYVFLKKISPQLAVISAGRDNRYGFPKPHILRRYQQLGIPLWRTDRQGTLTLQTDGYKMLKH